jgi:hypothetical protein
LVFGTINSIAHANLTEFAVNDIPGFGYEETITNYLILLLEIFNIFKPQNCKLLQS